MTSRLLPFSPGPRRAVRLVPARPPARSAAALVPAAALSAALLLPLPAAAAEGASDDAPAGSTPPPAAPVLPAAPAPAPTVLRRQRVEPLPGGLDGVLMVNDNNPELIRGEGILLSGFDPRRGWDGRALGVPSAHLDVPLNGRFELFSHHVYAGRPESLDSTLWLAVLAAPRDLRAAAPLRLRLLSGATSLSQATAPGQSAAPFLPLPPLLAQQFTQPVWSGPGSRVATELLSRSRSPELPADWTLAPGRLTPLVVLPLPVRGLDPLLNGRNLQLRFDSDGPVDLAVLAAFGPNGSPPDGAVWSRILEGGLSPKEHAPSPRGAAGPIIYSRVSGVQSGSTWRGRFAAAGGGPLPASLAPISWPIASLAKGTLGTGQVQTAELKAAYPDTAWAAHGNYGVTYELSLPLRNDTAAPLTLQLALESPLKHDQPLGGLRFRLTPSPSVVFRGTVEVAGLDGPDGRPEGRQAFHLVQRAGQQGPALGSVRLAPGQERRLEVRLIYPADATPPQVLSLLPAPAPTTASAPGAPVKQSPSTPATAP